jgi:nicotinate-nucleotide adenylyltransferase
MDAFSGFASWHRWREITEYAHIVVMTRPGSRLPEQGELADFIALHRVRDPEALASRNNGLLLAHNVSALEISGTQIRRLLGKGRRADFLLPHSTLDYIHDAGLYREGNDA